MQYFIFILMLGVFPLAASDDNDKKITYTFKSYIPIPQAVWEKEQERELKNRLRHLITHIEQEGVPKDGNKTLWFLNDNDKEAFIKSEGEFAPPQGVLAVKHSGGLLIEILVSFLTGGKRIIAFLENGKPSEKMVTLK